MSLAKTKAPRKSAGRNNGSKENAIRFCGGVYVAKTLLSLQAFCPKRARPFWNKKIRSVSGPDFLCRMFRVSVYAFLAMSHRAVKATASLMAISESILRLIWMPATFRPCMKVE